MAGESMQDSYVNLAKPTVEYLLELVRAHGGGNPKARQSESELAMFLERFTPEQMRRDERVREYARTYLSLGDELAMDDNAPVAEGDENGAHVMTWSWVSFVDSEDLNKDKE